MTEKLPIHRLPLPARTLQGSLPRLKLDDQPSAQRRSTTFAASTPGVWARVYPMWTGWPLRITKDEVAEMGVDIEKGEQVDVEDVLRRWDTDDTPVDDAFTGANEGGEANGNGNGLEVKTSKHRSKLESQILGVSQSALEGSLPHLDVGDASIICNEGAVPSSDSSPEGSKRRALMDILSGQSVLVSPGEGSAASSNGDANGDTGERARPSYGPWSTRYCGHQFGVWAGQLGDGRAISLLETESGDGGRQEIQLKGAGRTPFSRQADGLAVMRSGVREFLGCEAIAALGIPTTRSLALLTTPNLPVMREFGAEPPSLLARLAPTFIRIGHFEALNPGKAGQNFRQLFLGGNWQNGEDEKEAEDGPLGGQGNLEGLRELTEWCKYIMGFEGKPTVDWVKDVVRRNAEMVAQWQVYGFMHGVLNSDNISVMGLTIDYGPYAFMDIYDEGHICNHSDPSGLYSYRRQPERVLFALDKLVSSVSPIIGYEKLEGKFPTNAWSEGKTKEELEKWSEACEQVMEGWHEEYVGALKTTEKQGWMKRFGLQTSQDTDDRDIIADFLTLLHAHSLDFHTSFRHISSFKASKVDDKAYFESFIDGWVELSGQSIPSDSVDRAKEGLTQWLSVYSRRILEKAEQAAWNQSVEDGVVAGHNAPQEQASATGNEGWEDKREKTMKAVNPRFVLRQWVLEEVISDIEKAGWDGIGEARRSLARVLDMSCKPFEDWDDTCSEEGAKRVELCAVGKKEMLGFQCSCSS